MNEEIKETEEIIQPKKEDKKNKKVNEEIGSASVWTERSCLRLKKYT